VRVDIAPAADRRRIAEPRRYRDHRRGEAALGVALLRVRGRQREGGENRGAPGAEVLGGDLLAGDLAHVVVDVCRVDGLPLSILVEVLKELVTGQVLS